MGQSYKNNKNSSNQFVLYCCDGYGFVRPHISLIHSHHISNEFFSLRPYRILTFANRNRTSGRYSSSNSNKNRPFSRNHSQISRYQIVNQSHLVLRLNIVTYNLWNFRRRKREGENEREKKCVQTIGRPPRRISSMLTVNNICAHSYLPSRIKSNREKRNNEIVIRRFKLFAVGLLCSHESV